LSTPSGSSSSHGGENIGVFNQTNNTNITNADTINNGTINNNNINILNFGSENIQCLMENPQFVNQMLRNLTERPAIYGMVQPLKSIYFNPDIPENQTVKKRTKKDDFVQIHRNGSSSNRLYEDVHDDISNKLEQTFNLFFSLLISKGIHKKDRERMIIRRFCNDAVKYDWQCDSIEEFDVKEPDITDIEERKRKKRLMRVIKDELYNMTQYDGEDNDVETK
jgi:hypothetical protein